MEDFLHWDYLPNVDFYNFVFLFSCSAPSNVEKALDEQILHFGLGSEPQYLDPHLANSVSAHNVIIALIEGLVRKTRKLLSPFRELLKDGIFQKMVLNTLFIYEKMPSGVTVILSLLTTSYILTKEFLTQN